MFVVVSQPKCYMDPLQRPFFLRFEVRLHAVDVLSHLLLETRSEVKYISKAQLQIHTECPLTQARGKLVLDLLSENKLIQVSE